MSNKITRSKGLTNFKIIHEITKSEQYHKRVMTTLDGVVPMFDTEATMQSDVFETNVFDADTTFGCDEATIRTQATQASFMPCSGLAAAQEETYFLCPVCIRPLESVLSMANENLPWMGDLRPVRKHCKSTHPEEYIWNVCPREEDSKKIPLSVACCLITSAFKTTAMQLPLPEGEVFPRPGVLFAC